MLTNLTEEELELIELLHYPVASIECLFSNLDNLSLFNDNFSHVRLYQLPMLSYEYIIDYDNLTKESQLKLREKAGTVYALAARTIGKTLMTEKLDIPISAILLDNDVEGFTSFDALHIRGVLEDVISAFENHPILQSFEIKVNRSPNYQLRTKNGWFLESVNMNVGSKSPGKAFHQKHFDKLFVEEASYETEEVYKKRAESTKEGGHQVIRATGMTNFTKQMPIGEIFYDIKNKPFIVNLPSYVSPLFTKESKQKAIKKHGGEHTASFRIFIEGEVIEQGWSVFDMQRVRENYLENKVIKHFEVEKKNFGFFKNIIVLTRPNNAEEVYVCADIGESTSATEIIILFKTNDKYRYEYNITLYNLTDKEQEEIFDFVIQEVKANIISLDCGEGLGRVIYRYLEEKYGKEHLVYYDGSKKIKVDFERDENNNVVFKNGEPVYKEEFMSEWSVQRLKQLLYDNRILIPQDYKFDKQFNSVICTQSGNRMIYDCIADEDHLYSAFKVFAIAQWDKEFSIIKPVKVKKFFKSGV